MDKEIDEIYDVIDTLMSEQKFDIIDFIIKHLDLDSWTDDSLYIALSFLTVTLPVKSRLKERLRLVAYIEDVTYGHTTESLLSGLR